MTVDDSSSRRDARRHPSLLGGLLLIPFGVLIGAMLLEISLRVASLYIPYLVLPPNIRREFNPARGVMPGINGISVYTTNAHGIRGDIYEPAGRTNILAIGGSTTECLYLDDEEAWPYLLQAELNGRIGGDSIWIGNVGRSGHGLVEHIIALKYFVTQLDIDAVIVMAGINDLLPAIRNPRLYDAAMEDSSDLAKFLPATFYRAPPANPGIHGLPFPQSLALWNLGERFLTEEGRYADMSDIRVEDEAGLHYLERRQLLQAAPHTIKELPELSDALRQYQKNLEVMIGTANDIGLMLFLVTQPVIWSDHLSDEAEGLLWLGYLGRDDKPHGRYSAEILAKAMDAFNEKMLDLCAIYGLTCVDLAGEMSGEEIYFYDDAHFNEQGARKVAQVLAPRLIASIRGNVDGAQLSLP